MILSNLSQLISLHYCYTYLVDQISVGLLLYAHIPTALTALIFGSYILYRDRKLPNTTLFFVCISFATWCFLSFSTWLVFSSPVTMFTWSLLDLVGLIMFFFSYYFIYTFVTNRDLPIWQKVTGILMLLPTAVSTLFGLNLVGFDGNNCVAMENDLITRYPYFIEAFFIILVFIFIVSQYRKAAEKKTKNKILLAGAGVFTFLIFFFSATLLVNILDTSSVSSYVYNYEIYGLFGMPLLLIFLGYLIVRYKAFNIKLLGAQALVISLVALIGSQFLFVQSVTAQILTAVTLVITGAIGLILIRSVKKVDFQNEELEKASQEKSEFMSFAAHQIRTPITVVKGYASNLLDGDYGALPAEATKQVQKMLISSNDLIYLIADYLDKAKMELNQLKYAMNPFDLKAMVTKVVGDFRIGAEHHNVPVKLSVPEGVDFTISADENKIKQIVGNLIDNSIKYNVEGGHVDVSLVRDDEKKVVRIVVADNGRGIAPETMPYLFLKFGRGSNAEKSSINGTGLGLYLAKQMLDAHHGSIHAESEGLGKGSKFIVELPIGEVSAPEVK